MLKQFVEQGIHFEKDKEIRETEQFSQWRVARATIGFFATPESRKRDVPEIHKQTAEKITQIHNIADSRTTASPMWITQQLALRNELCRTVPKIESSDLPTCIM